MASLINGIDYAKTKTKGHWIYYMRNSVDVKKRDKIKKLGKENYSITQGTIIYRLSIESYKNKLLQLHLVYLMSSIGQ